MEEGKEVLNRPLVLVVDDDPAIGDIIKNHFLVIYDVEIVYSIAQASKILDKQLPDAILLDISLPDGNGVEFCHQLKNDVRTQAIPVILLTATLPDERRHGLEVGADDFLFKPFNLSELTARLRASIKMKMLYDENVRRYAVEKELRLLNELLIGMYTHDLRNPLTATMGYIQIMQAQSQALDDKMKHNLQSANDSCQHLMEMINQMVDVARMEDKKMPLKLKKEDIVSMVQAKVQQYKGIAEANGLRIEAQVSLNKTEIRIDGTLIGRVLENLIANAIKHTPNGGKVIIGLEASPDDKGMLLLWVRDTGEGIPAEYHEHIFQKYGQVALKKMGRSYDTGLGLVFCKMVVELHGGKIWVNSEVNEGSTFTVELPAK